MMKTENVILAAGATATLNVSGKWFRVRRLVGGSEPKVSVKALSLDGSKQLADGLMAYDGDLYGWDDHFFRDLTFHNPTGDAQTFDVIISDQGRHEVAQVTVGNFPSAGGSVILASADVLIPAGGAVTLIKASNDSRRSIVIQSRRDNNPAALPLRLGDQASVAVNAGIQLAVGDDPAVIDTTAAVYCVNPDAGIAQNVTVFEVMN